MALLFEKVVVTAKEFLDRKNINDAEELNSPLFLSKHRNFGWDLQFGASSIFAEIVWKISIKGSTSAWNEMDRLFSPSPVATHSNFRGSKEFKTGNMPELGALACWKRGNSWQGAMGIVIGVSDDKQIFDIAEARILTGSDNNFLLIQEGKGKRLGLPFSNEKLNLLGFVYPKHEEIR